MQVFLRSLLVLSSLLLFSHAISLQHRRHQPRRFALRKGKQTPPVAKQFTQLLDTGALPEIQLSFGGNDYEFESSTGLERNWIPILACLAAQFPDFNNEKLYNHDPCISMKILDKFSKIAPEDVVPDDVLQGLIASEDMDPQLDYQARIGELSQAKKDLDQVQQDLEVATAEWDQVKDADPDALESVEEQRALKLARLTKKLQYEDAARRHKALLSRYRLLSLRRWEIVTPSYAHMRAWRYEGDDEDVLVVAFRWMTEERALVSGQPVEVDDQMAKWWFTEAGAAQMFLRNFWGRQATKLTTLNFMRKMANAHRYAWLDDARTYVDQMKQSAQRETESGERVPLRLVFTGFSLGSVLAQLMSIYHTATDNTVHPAVVFGGNGIREVLKYEADTSPFWKGKEAGREWAGLKSFADSFLPYVWNVADNGDATPRIGCQNVPLCLWTPSADPNCVPHPNDPKQQKIRPDITAKRQASELNNGRDTCNAHRVHHNSIIGQHTLAWWRHDMTAREGEEARSAGSAGKPVLRCVAGNEWKGRITGFCKQALAKGADTGPRVLPRLAAPDIDWEQIDAGRVGFPKPPQ